MSNTVPFMVDPAIDRDRKPSVPIKLFYAVGQAAQSGGFDTALPFTFFYYTAVLGLSGALVGAALAISLAFDALVDPLIGSWSDNIRSRLGRRLPLMMVSAPLIFVALGLLFMPPAGLSQTGLFLWLSVTCVAVRCAVSLFNVPYFALGGELTDGYAERSSVVAYRAVAGIIAGLAVTAVAFTVFFTSARGGLKAAASYPGFGWTVATMLVVLVAVCCGGVRRYAAGLPQPQGRPESVLRRFPAEVGEVFRNPSFRLLFLSAVVFFAAIGLNGALNAHSGVYVWKLRAETMQLPAYAYPLGILGGIALAPVLSRRFEKKIVVMAGLADVIFIWALLPTLRAFRWYAPEGDAALPALIVNGLVIGLGAGLCAIAYPSMMADAADEHEYLYGSRREGLYFAGLGFAMKAAGGLGVLAGGLALDVIGFPAHPSLASAPGEPVLARLMLAHGPGAAVIGLIALGLFLPYGLTRARHDAISAELRRRRARGELTPSVDLPAAAE